MINHISTVTRACYFHLRRICQAKRCLNEHCLRVLVQALVISRLDYCNSVLVGLPKSTLQPLTSVLHSAARVIKNLKPRDHITPPLQQSRWLPIQARITFKICLLMFNIFSGFAPQYMTSMVTQCSSITSRQGLRSASNGDFIHVRSHLQFGNRAFSVVGPQTWNNLPEYIRRSKACRQFKTNLKTHLFALNYD